MNKNFKNDNGATTGLAGFIAFFSISLVFSSVVISWMLLNAYGVSVTGLDFPTYNPNTAYDFTKDAFSNKTTFDGASWSFSGSGLTPTGTNSYVIFRGITQNGDGSITNEYNIYNPDLKDYSIILSDSGIARNEIVVSQDGIHWPRNSWINVLLGEEDFYFYPLENANQRLNTNIKTVYNPDAGIREDATNTLYFYLDNELLFVLDSSYNVGSGSFIIGSDYGGVGNFDNMGLTVQSFTTSADKTTGDLTKMLEAIQLWFIATIKLIVWNVPEQYLPWELNLLFIKSQAFCVALGIAVWARG